jgi:hypothetical protein
MHSPHKCFPVYCQFDLFVFSSLDRLVLTPTLLIVTEFFLGECSNDSGKEIVGLYTKHSAFVWVKFSYSENGGAVFLRNVGTNTLPSFQQNPTCKIIKMYTLICVSLSSRCNPKFLAEQISVYQFSFVVTVQRYKSRGMITEQVQELKQIAIQC